MAEKQRWTQPTPGLLFTPPNDFILEKDKDADWYCQYARWIVATFYNQQRQPMYTGEIITKGIAQEAIENWTYVFGNQFNYKYKYATTDFSGNELPAQWIPGGKISSLIDHMRGLLLQSVENIEVTAKNLSSDVSSKRAEMYEKLMLEYETRKLMEAEMPEGVRFVPVNDQDADFSTKEDIEQYTTKWQDKYSIIAEKIGRSQIFEDNLKEKFVQCGTNQFNSALSSVHTEVRDGYITNTVIPDYEVIWDNRSNDPQNNEAFVCGFVKHDMPYQEVIRRYQSQLDEKEIGIIRNLAIDGYSNIDQFTQYYNTGFGVGNYFNWWNNVGSSKMTVAVATVYFIAPRDWQYKDGYNKAGYQRLKKISDQAEAGDYSGWDVHQCTLIGNAFIVDWGYMPNTLRNRNKKGRPLLPMRTLCAGMALNQGRSVVSKLRHLQDEIDMYAYKIKEKVAKDVGKTYVFNGNKFSGVTPVEVMNDLKSIGVHISDGSSGEIDDPQNNQRMVEVVDMTLDPNIGKYIELRAALEAEMEMTVSISRIALGQQPAVIGKAVQEQTINQNSMGTATLMWEIMRHFNAVVQYNVNLKQMLYQFRDTVEETLVIGDEGAELIRILNPQEFGTQPLLVFLNIASTLDPQQRAELRTIALSEAQNGKLDTVDYIENVLLAPTLNQAVKGLKYSKEKQLRELKRINQQAEAMNMQHQADMANQAYFHQVALTQLKEDNENFRAELSAVAKDMNLLLKQIVDLKQPPSSPLQQQMANQNQ